MANPDDEPKSNDPGDNHLGSGSPAAEEFSDLEKQLDQLWPQTTEALSPFVGRRIAHYDLKRVLGSGAFGVVYLAEDTRLGREVALKLPRPEVLVDADKRDRFAAEASLAARLDHAGIVPIYHAELDGPAPYIASGFCNGPDLADWLEEHGQASSWQDAVELLAKVADALHYAHMHGVHHRDLKPANILLASSAGSPHQSQALSSYEPCIADFGLSKLADANLTDTRSSLLVGTPLYMAPEQIDKTIGSDNQAATDIYSLGVILFELLAGRTPISGESYVDVLDGIRTGKAASLRSLNPSCPRDLERICRRCLERNPAARYQSAEALASDLRRCLRSEPIEEKSHGLWARLDYWCRRPARVAEAGWFTLWVQAIWMVWVIGTDTFIGFSNVELTEGDWWLIQRDTLFTFSTVHVPMAYLGWKTIKGTRWAPWGAAILTAMMMPGLFASIATGPVFFAPVYKGSTSWFVWAVYFMLITCFTIQIAYNVCAVLATRRQGAASSPAQTC